MKNILTDIIKNMNNVSDFTTEADLKFYIAKKLEDEYEKIILEYKFDNDRHHVDIFIPSKKTCLEFKFNKKMQGGATQARNNFRKDINILKNKKKKGCECYAVFITNLDTTYDKANKEKNLKSNLIKEKLDWYPIPSSDYYYTIKQI